MIIAGTVCTTVPVIGFLGRQPNVRHALCCTRLARPMTLPLQLGHFGRTVGTLRDWTCNRARCWAEFVVGDASLYGVPFDFSIGFLPRETVDLPAWSSRTIDAFTFHAGESPLVLVTKADVLHIALVDLPADPFCVGRWQQPASYFAC